MGKISYSAVVLDEKSHNKLLNLFNMFSGMDNWTVFAHHMTICMGELPEDWKSRIGEVVTLDGTRIGWTDLAFAIKIDSNVRIMPGTPHVTIAINTLSGGKPKDSNGITEWQTGPSTPIKLIGTIQEISS